ncbi:S-adenosylmethionine:tRNA ribosyltransferase-isomerase [Evansella sp. LMS18]|jgi:S-adenosylmethionine:tRNA ribosyltransferase-isomerase|uniref:S-adenosylmethionine:tRNA ribosyltransferase-isomerase n=1 Tax=Evansella sp. LMS18 TaxID=2924033 RepID=UPI0020D107EF|nr:S-adenosylmethionine:tRNA ribosyltransferase-isomerase [Evansella sp. LMS18]UTR10635.1 S-adenosylmethionine:tRNA ribosyltransferase-isomerase [Evansella sp. LMS18]
MNTSLSAETFTIPEELNAAAPPEVRGIRRDQVKMMVLSRTNGKLIHSHFNNLTDFLREGDLLVLNNSRTIPAVLKADVWRNGIKRRKATEVRLARKIYENGWEVLLPEGGVKKGDKLIFSRRLQGKAVLLKDNYPFVLVRFSLTGRQLYDEIYKLGEPVRYEYIHHPWDLGQYQTVYGSVPGSVEMPSAGRAFSWELISQLKKIGVKTAFLQLHTGLSYLTDNQWELPPGENKESYMVPQETAELVTETKQNGGRIIAVGTTVVRALETAGFKNGRMTAQSGWTDIYINETSSLSAADGLITGFHEPEASHLNMLTAFVERKKLISAYNTALEEGYLWHEFGDINLIL